MVFYIACEGLKQVVYFIANAFIHVCIFIDQLVDRLLKGAAYFIQAAVTGAWAWVKEKIFDRAVPVMPDVAPNVIPNVVPDIIGLTVSSDDKDISDIALDEIQLASPAVLPGFSHAKQQANRVVVAVNDDIGSVMDNSDVRRALNNQ